MKTYTYHCDTCGAEVVRNYRQAKHRPVRCPEHHHNPNGKPKQERRPPAFPPVYARDWPAGTPVAVGAQYARVLRVVRRYGVVLLDRQIGKYATYEPRQLRKLTVGERAAFEWREKLYGERMETK